MINDSYCYLLCLLPVVRSNGRLLPLPVAKSRVITGEGGQLDDPPLFSYLLLSSISRSIFPRSSSFSSMSSQASVFNFKDCRFSTFYWKSYMLCLKSENAFYVLRILYTKSSACMFRSSCVYVRKLWRHSEIWQTGKDTDSTRDRLKGRQRYRRKR